MYIGKKILGFLVLFLITACSPSGDSGSIYKFFKFNQYFLDSNGDIVLEYQYNFSDDKKYIKFHMNSTKWRDINKTVSPISEEQITFKDEKTIVMNKSGKKIFELMPPSIEEIEKETGISLSNSVAYYNVFKSGREYKWDRKTYVVHVGIEKAKKDSNSLEYTFREIEIFSLVYNNENNNWSINYIGQAPTLKDRLYYYESDLNINTEFHIKRFRNFISEEIGLCDNWGSTSDEKCYVRNSDGTLEYKKLYGDILSQEYKVVLDDLYKTEAFKSPAESSYFFDKNHNMHLFFNDIKNANGKYFMYKMYKKENPTAPLYEQKIAWE